MHFTVHKDSRIDQKIDRDLGRIRDFILPRIPGVSAMVLVGGFGRGEGSVLLPSGPGLQDDDIRLLNDYDIVLITTADVSNQSLKDLARVLAGDIGIRAIDLLTIPVWSLSRLAPSIFNYDLKYGGYVFWGEQNVLEAIPSWKPSDVFLMEGKVLLFNRLVCLLEGFSTDFLNHRAGDQELFFLATQSAKAALALCDSLLLLSGRYQYRYIEKCEQFVREFGAQHRLTGFVQWATNFKLNPQWPPDRDLIRQWMELRAEYLATLLWYLDQVYSYTFGFRDFVDFGRFYRRLEQTAQSEVELAGIYLLCSIDGQSVNHEMLLLAEGCLKSVGYEQHYDPDWDRLRELCVSAWFELCH